MPKKIVYSIIISMLFAPWAYGQKTELPTSPIVGGGRDKHGCLASAGSTFSIIKNTCIRLWEEKIKLKQTDSSGTARYFAAVIFSKDDKKAEVFVPDSLSGIVLTRTGRAGKYVYKQGNLALTVSNGYFLRKSGKLIYSLNGIVKD